MWSISQQFAIPIENSTWKIKPLPNIGANGYFLQNFSHFFSDGHKSSGVESKFDGIGFGDDCVGELVLFLFRVIDVGDFVGEFSSAVLFDENGWCFGEEEGWAIDEAVLHIFDVVDWYFSKFIVDEYILFL